MNSIVISLNNAQHDLLEMISELTELDFQDLIRLAILLLEDEYYEGDIKNKIKLVDWKTLDERWE